MSRFLDLFRHDTPPPPGKIYADERSDLFPGVVAQSSRLKLWDREGGVPQAGAFLLIGVATWSGYDMKLLDLIEATEGGPETIGVFDAQECQSVDDFEKRIPGIGSVFQVPAVGLWQDGQLLASGWGHDGRKLVFLACHIDPARMAELLDHKSAPA
jgi:hypothetical protein